MVSALVETKLHVPRVRRTLVARPRLAELLSRGSDARLTLVSAPAGFGKTTLLTAWLTPTTHDHRAVAWVSLDPGDSEPVSFWSYVITALQAAVPGVGAGALAWLRQPRSPPIEAVLATVLNDLSAAATEVSLILDDYHLIDGRDVHEGLAFLLEHLPPRVHLVISTRSDPPLPLARMRVRDELVEIRAGDLRFTPVEAAAYLNGVMGLALTEPSVAALEGRTEGWIAALQLAALSLQGRDDVSAFIDSFTGNDRYVVDYLVEEVLERQSEQVRTFLLETSILGRLSGPLCDAVTGNGGGRALLEALDRGNLFLVPLDDDRRWYRYHHLFADVLRARLSDEHRDRVAELHQRASAWFERNGERAVAIEHALAGTDFDRAAYLIELAIPAARRDRQEARVRRWLEALPDDVLRVRPVLSVSYAGSSLSTGELDIEARLRDAEQWLVPVSGGDGEPKNRPADMVVADDDEFRRLPNQIAMYRAGRALILRDIAATTVYAQRSLDLAAVDDHLGRGGAEALLGLAYWTTGDLDAAYRWYAAGTESLDRAGHLADVVGCAVTLADIRVGQGRLRDAMSAYERGLRFATARAAPLLWGAADMHVGMGELFCEFRDLDAARAHLQVSRDLGEHTGMPHNRYRWPAAMAQIRVAEGDLSGALDLLDRAGDLYANDFSPDVRPVPALKARIWIMQGRLDEAAGWARQRGVSSADDLSYLGEFQHITLARVLRARYEADGDQHSHREATALLARLLSAAEGGGRTGSVIEILVLQALSHHSAGDTPGALVPLKRALTLAEPEGFVRVFVAEGRPMALLLGAVAGQRVGWGYVRRLLDACGPDGAATEAEPRRESVAHPGQTLTEPLSAREREVLRLLGTDLDGPDIARELVVSLNTVRTHTKNIYTKLGVNSRRAAVTRAEELDLLRPTRNRR